MHAAEIVRNVVDRFGELEASLRQEPFSSSNERWTRNVLTTLCKAGQALGYKVGANPRYVEDEFRNSPEWLYDVYWLKYDKEGWVQSMPLAAESEWGGRDKVDYDYQKLLVARAKVRVMVYEGRKRDGGTEGFAKRFAYHVERFRGDPGDTYLLIAYESHDAGWGFKYHQIVAQQWGQEPTLEALSPS